jgi:hypothetical protein
MGSPRSQGRLLANCHLDIVHSTVTRERRLRPSAANVGQSLRNGFFRVLAGDKASAAVEPIGH